MKSVLNTVVNLLKSVYAIPWCPLFALVLFTTATAPALTLGSTSRYTQVVTQFATNNGPFDSTNYAGLGPFSVQVSSAGSDQYTFYAQSNSFASDLEVTSNSLLFTAQGSAGMYYAYAGQGSDVGPGLLSDIWQMDVLFHTDAFATYTLQAFGAVAIFSSAVSPAQFATGEATCGLTGGTNSIFTKVPHASNGPVVFKGTFPAGTYCEISCSLGCGGLSFEPSTSHPTFSFQRVLTGFDFRVTEIPAINAAPTLNYSFAGPNLVLSWPVAAHGFNLQAATSIAPGSTWTSVPVSPTLVDDTLTVIIPMTSPPQFFRLIGTL
jgi:hypothetical protein